MLIDFSGTAGQIAQAFHTQMDQLERERRVAHRQLQRSADSRGAGARDQGLCLLERLPAAARCTSSASQYTFAGCATTTAHPTEPGTCYAMTPEDNQTIYNLNPLYQAGYSGQGQTIALVEDTDVYSCPGDWNTYRSTFGLSTYTQGSFSQVHPGWLHRSRY